MGDDRFVERMQGQDETISEQVGVPKAQTRPPAQPLGEINKRYKSRNESIVAAHESGDYSYQQIADFYGLHFTTVGKIVRQARGEKGSMA